MMNDIGTRIAEYRKNKKLTQEELAENLQVSAKTLSRWETGKSVPNIDLLELIADVLNVSTTDLLCRGDKKNSKEEIEEVITKTIELYNLEKKNRQREVKRRAIVTLLIVILCIIVSTIGVYFYTKNKFKTDFYNINSAVEKYYVTGYYIKSKQKSILAINSIDIGEALENYDTIKTEALAISIESDGKLFLEKTIAYEEEVLLKDLIKEYNAEIISTPNSEEYKNFNKDNAMITIEYGNNLQEYINIHLIIE